MDFFHFYWLFVRAIYRYPVKSPRIEPAMRSFSVFFDVGLYKLLTVQSSGRLFERLWRSRDIIVAASKS